MNFKDIAEHFYNCGIEWASDMEFGNPKLAKKFEQCWEEFNERFIYD